MTAIRRSMLIGFLQTLKERFAEQLPEKIEQIKKLRKWVANCNKITSRAHLTSLIEIMAPR